MQHNTLARDSESYFPVTLKPVLVGDEGDPVTARDYQAVVRGDTSDVLGIHRGSYKLVPNREVFQRFEDAIVASGIPVDGSRSRKGSLIRGAPPCVTIAFPP